MKLKTIAITTTLIVGFSSFLVSILLSIGLAYRQPAEVVTDNSVCQYLDLNTFTIQEEHSCKFQVDDYRKNGQLVELSWLDKDKQFSVNRSISVPESSIRVVVEMQRHPLPIWLYFVFTISMLMTLLPLRHLAFILKSGKNFGNN